MIVTRKRKDRCFGILEKKREAGNDQRQYNLIIQLKSIAIREKIMGRHVS